MKIVVPRNPVSILIPLTFIVLLLGGCGHGSLSPHPAAIPCGIPCDAGLPFASHAEISDAAAFAQESQKWQSVAQTAEGLFKRAQAHLHLAALLLNHKNPNESPHQAYLEIVKAIELWPDLKNDIVVASWVGLLARHEALKVDFSQERVDFENDLSGDRRLIKSLGEEITNLKEKLEKLKRAEMVVERKRRAFK